DHIKGRATNAATGETCVGAASFAA
ncbi:MAG: hypothetical protein QOI81_2106, partial [Actinomycetota bacterium]|nr:hypothetical protein [Actinomycetota bacterium]